jgi:penicillin-binding protein 1A
LRVHGVVAMPNQKKKNKAPEEGGAEKKRKRRGVLRFLVAAALWGLIFAGVIIAWHALSLPDTASLENASQRKAGIHILARDGTLLARYGSVYGEPVSLKSLPPYFSRAILATEDRRFYDHLGVDVIGILRALVKNVFAGRIRQGGSTITQQLAKNLFLTQERTISRKIRETLLAFWLEHKFTKDQILTIYLNRVYLGAGVYGVDAAARAYFDKPARKLTVYQSAVIAGLLKAPTRYNPAVHPKRAAKRANQVLLNMVGAGWISENVARKQFQKSVRTATRKRTRLNVRYFTDWIMGRISGLVGYITSDLIIRTTLDTTMQKHAERTIETSLRRAKTRNVSEAAFLSMTPNGAIQAMSGGADYGHSQFNRATQAQRQPGSAFKLFVYLAGVENGMRPKDRVHDSPVKVQGWTPRNYSRKHRGAITLREGAARSSNAVAVAVAEKVGRTKVLQAARRLGVTSKLGQDPSLALGAYEMSLIELVAAYAVIANGGHGVWPHGILEIRDSDDKILYRHANERSPRLVTSRHVAEMNDLLHAVVAWGTGRSARFSRPMAGKTGTSQGNRDAWFIGYTRDLVGGVWMGNDNATPMKGVTGGSLPAIIWKKIMKEAHRKRPRRALPGVSSTLPAAD